MLLNVLPLIAGLLCMISPGLQSLRIIRTGEVAGLSVATTLLQVVNGTILTLVAFEYAVPTMLGVNILALLMSIGVLFQVSAISLSTYVSLSLGLVCWTVIAILLKNTPLIVTDIVINLSVLEVIRLKLTVPRSAPRLEERVAQASS